MFLSLDIYVEAAPPSSEPGESHIIYPPHKYIPLQLLLMNPVNGTAPYPPHKYIPLQLLLMNPVNGTAPYPRAIFLQLSRAENWSSDPSFKNFVENSDAKNFTVYRVMAVDFLRRVVVRRADTGSVWLFIESIMKIS
jgi:hypothetical protein